MEAQHSDGTSSPPTCTVPDGNLALISAMNAVSQSYVASIVGLSGPVPAGAPQYKCPCYKNPKRTGLNFIFPVSLRTEDPPSKWVLRGVCLLTTKD